MQKYVEKIKELKERYVKIEMNVLNKTNKLHNWCQKRMKPGVIKWKPSKKQEQIVRKEAPEVMELKVGGSE